MKVQIFVVSTVISSLCFLVPGGFSAQNKPSSAETRGEVTVNSVRLHYLQWGTPGKPVILMLTGTGGLGGVAEQYRDFAERVSQDYRVVAPEMRGTAQSEWRGPYTWQQIVNDIDGFVDQLRLAPVLLVGHSGGAHWGMAYAALHPKKVTRWVAVEPSSDPWGPPEPRPSFPVFKSTDDVYSLAKTRWGVSSSVDAILRETIGRGTRKLPDGTVAWTIDPEGYGIWIPRGREMQALLDQVRVPTLIIRGQTSPWRHELAVRWTSAIANAELVEVAAAGHVVHLANPDGFAREVCKFFGIASCESRSTGERPGASR